MQTFLPYPDFRETAEVLDGVRLRNQRRECLALLSSLYSGEGWSHHPAAKMWAGSERCLIIYCLEICEEVTRRGWLDSVADTLLLEYWHLFDRTSARRPWWLGWEEFHESHRSALLRKDPAHYRKYFNGVPTNLPYVWPRHNNSTEHMPYPSEYAVQQR